jgi:hypothetical protein
MGGFASEALAIDHVHSNLASHMLGLGKTPN